VAIRNAQLYRQVPLIGGWNRLRQKARVPGDAEGQAHHEHFRRYSCTTLSYLLPMELKVVGNAYVLPTRTVYGKPGD